jgi:hypothetical protein
MPVTLAARPRDHVDVVPRALTHSAIHLSDTSSLMLARSTCHSFRRIAALKQPAQTLEARYRKTAPSIHFLQVHRLGPLKCVSGT